MEDLNEYNWEEKMDRWLQAFANRQIKLSKLEDFKEARKHLKLAKENLRGYIEVLIEGHCCSTEGECAHNHL